MTWTDNMQSKGAPRITKAAAKDYTKVTFKPDLERFSMTVSTPPECTRRCAVSLTLPRFGSLQELDDDIVALFRKRVYDMAGVTDKSVRVYLNGKRLSVNNFESYVGMYQTDEESKVVFENINDRWEVGFACSDGKFDQVSFVNGICTTKGGQHVNYIADQVTKYLVKVVTKKNKGVKVKPHQIKNHMWVFVRSLIDNPAFDSQTKETLTTRATKFGSTAAVSEKVLKKSKCVPLSRKVTQHPTMCLTLGVLTTVAKTDIVNHVLNWAKFKQKTELNKKSGRKTIKLTGIPKLDDANFAGGARGHQCTLILTEGDSAKSLAVSGLSVIGRDYYGVFPLKGKLLNVREASHKKIMENEVRTYSSAWVYCRRGSCSSPCSRYASAATGSEQHLQDPGPAVQQAVHRHSQPAVRPCYDHG